MASIIGIIIEMEHVIVRRLLGEFCVASPFCEVVEAPRFPASAFVIEILDVVGDK